MIAWYAAVAYLTMSAFTATLMWAVDSPTRDSLPTRRAAMWTLASALLWPAAWALAYLLSRNG